MYLCNSDDATADQHGPSVAQYLVDEVAADEAGHELGPLEGRVQQHVLGHADVQVSQDVGLQGGRAV